MLSRERVRTIAGFLYVCLIHCQCVVSHPELYIRLEIRFKHAEQAEAIVRQRGRSSLEACSGQCAGPLCPQCHSRDTSIGTLLRSGGAPRQPVRFCCAGQANAWPWESDEFPQRGPSAADALWKTGRLARIVPRPNAVHRSQGGEYRERGEFPSSTRAPQMPSPFRRYRRHFFQGGAGFGWAPTHGCN